MVPMRAEEVIVTHGNTDFDAFAAMLAARRLYPGAVVAVGALNRNVRDFYRLHAEELGAVVEASRLELDAIRRLVVVEAAQASRLGELEQVALDPGVEKVLFDHHDEPLPDWAEPDASVLTTDGALTTTLGGHPRRARDRADRARGDRVRARDPRGHGVADVSRRPRSATSTRSPGACVTAHARISSRSTCTRRSAKASAIS